MKKNVASQSIGVQMITAADGTAFTGAVSVLVTINNGTQTAGGGTAPAHEGNGYHSYTPTQAETNGDHIAFTFTGTGAIPATLQVYTGFPQTVDNATNIAAILTDTAEIGVAGAGLTNINLPNQTMDIVGSITGNLSGSVGSVTGAVGSVTAGVTVTTNNDKTGYTASTVSDKTGYSISGTKTTLDALNDIAATAVVSAGAITTLAGAVVNVDLVDTCTTNTDMRGTDGANTVVPDAAGTAPTLAEILQSQLTESYAADGVAPTLTQAIFLIQQTIGDFAISGTTITTKQLNGTTTAATYTLDNGTNPTSRTRAT